MVRSLWVGPVFGVLALSGLAEGQSTPSVPAAAGASKDRIVVVQESGKPAQRCKVLKMWTEPDGTPAFQVEALDTGELITIEEADANAPRPGVVVRSACMRVFHWGVMGPAPVGTPEPPSNAVVVGYPIDIHPPAPEPSRIAAAAKPAPAQPWRQWPSAHAEAPTADFNVAAIRPTPPATPPVAATTPPARKVELTPITQVPVAAAPAPSAPVKPMETKPAPTVAAVPATPAPAPASPYGVSGPAKTVWKPYDSKPTTAAPVTPADSAANASPYVAKPAPTVAATPAKPAVAPAPLAPAKEMVVAKKTDAPATAAPTPPAAPAKEMVVTKKTDAPATAATTPPAAPTKDPVAAKKVETTPAQPSDWRQSWGKMDAPQPPAPMPILPAPPALADATKSQPPHAVHRTDDPLNAPDKFAAVPQAGGFMPQAGGFDSTKSTTDKKTPPPAALALQQPPAAAKDVPPLVIPPLPGPTPPSAPTTVLKPTPPPSSTPAPTLAPAAAVKPTPTVPQPVATVRPTPAPAATPPTVPLGMGSVLAASSPELAPPASTPSAPAKAAVAIRADEPNAFTEQRQPGSVMVAANAFSAPAPAPASTPTASPRQTPSTTPDAVAMRTVPSLHTAAPQMPMGYVVQAGYGQPSSYSLPQVAGVLKDSLYPSQREWAAETLASMDWHHQPEIVDMLVAGAKADPAPGVRAECLHSLAKMQADTVPAVEAAKALQSDANDEVRQAAVEAYKALTASPSH
ncbi:MAG TPA: HEAT repeat domain-containing protein [Gemmataceae bacterium]|nr:HEAT repeat domain-containing protein [Gemmataceae bacterium]